MEENYVLIAVLAVVALFVASFFFFNNGQVQITGAVVGDMDNDGISDSFETAISHTDPNNWDTDGDMIYDSRELAWGRDPLDPTSHIYCCGDGMHKNTILDSDTDGLSDAYETDILGTNPNIADSDGDSYCDSYEIQQGFDPQDAISNPGGSQHMCVWFR